jgi:PKD repeat protein
MRPNPAGNILIAIPEASGGSPRKCCGFILLEPRQPIMMAVTSGASDCSTQIASGGILHDRQEHLALPDHRVTRRRGDGCRQQSRGHPSEHRVAGARTAMGGIKPKTATCASCPFEKGRAKMAKISFSTMRLFSYSIYPVLLVLVSSLVSPLNAQVTDTAPPELLSFSFTPNNIDVSAGPQAVNVTVHATDNLVGMSFTFVQFSSPSGGQYQSVFLDSSARISGNAWDGIYSASLIFPQFSEAGTWTVSFMESRDELGNRVVLQGSDITDRGFPNELEVFGGNDVAPPELLSLSFTPNNIDVSAGPQAVNVTVHATDNLVGVSFTFVQFSSPSGGQYQSVFLDSSTRISGNARDGIYSASLIFPQFSEAGTWTVSFMESRDELGNRVVLQGSDITDRGFPNELGVTENQAPHAEAGIDRNALVAELLTFDATGSSDSDGSIASYKWDFGDGMVAYGPIVKHAYGAPGQYSVTLSVTDDEGATATDEALVIVQTVSEEIHALVDLVEGLNLQAGIENSLNTKLQNALDASTASNAGNRQDARSKIEAFINAVKAQRCKEIACEQADALVAFATWILSVL